MNASSIAQLTQFTLDGTMPFPEIVGCLMQAGVQSCEVFLKAQRVLYLGRHGDQHVEWFPGAKA